MVQKIGEQWRALGNLNISVGNAKGNRFLQNWQSIKWKQRQQVEHNQVKTEAQSCSRAVV